MATVNISERGQITLPARVRHQLGLEPRGKIDLEVKGEMIILTPARSIRSIRGAFRPKGGGKRIHDWETVRTRTERAVAEETAREDR